MLELTADTGSQIYFFMNSNLEKTSQFLREKKKQLKYLVIIFSYSYCPFPENNQNRDKKDTNNRELIVKVQ